MKKTIILLTLIACCIACTGNRKKNYSMTNETLVRLETTMGDIIVKLYDETPKHRDNFIKLVKEGVYDGTLFHRVIQNFMIQAGDPTSKTANDTAKLGSGDVGYTIPAELVSTLYHKRGALAAARQPDNVNPERASSGCQFYIVTGQVFNEDQLIAMEKNMSQARLDTIFQNLARKHMKEIFKMRKADDTAGLLALQDTLEAQAKAQQQEEGLRKFTPEQIKIYTSEGGAPHLDGDYTVFGEVVEGMDAVSRIEAVKTNKADRPIENVRILKASVIND
ncbi:peptidylprolyl isomerase [Bacteroides gallinaceum]|uniref:peptidylprolyl isomerase n=1 Tax=Bacteroides gallinaceum TaxID=1462571 RepID=UPI0015B17EB3|nr:peptidylprolyl isomerase [Bacteroides gallinaceum]MDM8153119.1 peptidylprolyl isomerase [Bacteroides gallinaceum]